MAWAAVTSLKPGQAGVPRMDCHGADRTREDVPANEPCPVDLVSLLPSTWSHNLQIQKDPPAVKLLLLHPKDVKPLGWKSFEKPGGSMSPGDQVPTSSFLPLGRPTYG